MATWTSISNAAVAVGGIPSSSTVTALRDNPTAIAEAASGAPVVFAGWHPVDKVSVGDGKDGLIYSHAVTGNVSSVLTPDFADGYEYRIIAHDLVSTDAGTVRLNLNAYFQTTGTYRRLYYSPDGSGTSGDFGFDLILQTPRLSTKTHLALGFAYREGAITSNGQDTTSYVSTAQKLLRGQINFTAGNIQAGKIWMFGRREYASSP